MTMSTYPRQRITITACVLLLLGFALLRLPLDQRAYARESAGMLRMGRRQQEKNQARKGGMVRLSEVKEELVNHKDTKATKKVMGIKSDYLIYLVEKSTASKQTMQYELLLLYL